MPKSDSSGGPKYAVSARGPAPSPCIGVCHIDGSSGFCLGCFRTLPEIAQWHKKSDDERWAIIDEAEEREELAEEAEENQPSG